MSSNVAIQSLTRGDIEARMTAFKQLVDEAQRYQPGQAPAAFVQKLDQARDAIERDYAVQEKNGSGSRPGIFSRSKRKAWDAAQELKPADVMVKATLIALAEQYAGPSANRRMGKRPSEWQAAVNGAESQAQAALARLKGGDVSAAKELSASIQKMVDDAQAMTAEVSQKEAPAISELRGKVDGFQKVADDTGVFEGRKEEKAALSAARGATEALKGEGTRQQQIAQRTRTAVRPLVVGQLEADPAFADRGYNDMVSRSSEWGTVIGAANQVRSAASAFASEVSRFDSALQTAATNPGKLEQLDAQLAQAQDALRVEVQNLNITRQNHTQQHRVLSAQLVAAETALGLANRDLRRARGIAADRRDAVVGKERQIEGMERELQRLRKKIIDNGGTDPERGNGGPGSGNNGGPGRSGGANGGPGGSSNGGPGGAKPGNGGPGGAKPGNGGPGGTQPGNGGPGNGGPAVDLEQLKKQYARTKSDMHAASRQLGELKEEYRRAHRRVEHADAAVVAAVVVVESVQGAMAANDAMLAEAEGRYQQADGYVRRLESDIASTDRALQAAYATIDAAPQALASATQTFNGQRSTFNATLKSAKVKDDARGQVSGIALSAIDANAVAQAVANSDTATLSQISGAAVSGTTQRDRTAEGIKAGIDQNIEAVIAREVARTLER